MFAHVKSAACDNSFPGQDFCCFISEYHYLHEIQCAKDKINSLPAPYLKIQFVELEQ